VSVPTALSAATMAGISACVSDHLNRAPAVCAVCDQFISALDSIDGKKPYRDVEFKTAIAEWKQFLAPYTDAWARRKASVLIVIFRPKSSRTIKPTLGYVTFRAVHTPCDLICDLLVLTAEGHAAVAPWYRGAR
jgi:hypothetical protein